MGYKKLSQELTKSLIEHFQFPLWDTIKGYAAQLFILILSIPFMGYYYYHMENPNILIFFQFPLWDTNSVFTAYKRGKIDFQFPLWDTLSCIRCLYNKRS